MRLKNKIALITGACGGLGKHFCKTFLLEGAMVCLTDIDAEQIALVLSELGHEQSVMGNVMDVCDRRNIEAVVAKIVERFGRLDILVNSAGGSLHTPCRFEAIEDDHWDKVVDVNLKGTFLCSQVAVGQFRRQESPGNIVNVSAMAGRRLGLLAGCHYTSSKAGVIGLTRHLAGELGPEGIRVNAIAPTITLASERTVNLWEERPQAYKEKIISETPLRRLSTPDEVSAGVVFLCSDEASYITGVTLDINGGRFFG